MRSEGLEHDESLALSAREMTIGDLVAESAHRAPDAVAIRDEVDVVTYRELHGVTDRLAAFFLNSGLVAPEDVVATCIPRSRDLIIAELAVVKAGASYLPLDVSDPPARKEALIRRAHVRIILTLSDLATSVPRSGVTTLCLDTISDEIASTPLSGLTVDVCPDDLAYIMFTSGSTGDPKAVAVPHRAVVHLANGLRALGITERDTVLHAASPAFDASVFEVWVSLAYAATVAIQPAGPFDLDELADVVRRYDVTIMFTTTSLMHVVSATDPQLLAPIRMLVAGGEAMSLTHLRRMRDSLPATTIVNGYGPTETTVFATTHVIPPDLPPDAISVPIGEPVGQTVLHVTKDVLDTQAEEATGELLIGGRGLAYGYLGSPGLTAERFIPDPWAADGTRLYRTGDLVVRPVHGPLSFLGRSDEQLKIRGFRVEPNEIAATLRGHPTVRDCAVVSRGVAERKQVVAFVVAADVAETADILGFAKDNLAEYMVPDVLFMVDSFPRTSSGKIDVDELRRMAQEEAGHREELDSVPQGGVFEVTSAVAEEWSAVLGPAWDSSDFFGAGGNSLLAAQLAARLRRRLDLDFPLSLIFENSTLDSMTDALGVRLQQERRDRG